MPQSGKRVLLVGCGEYACNHHVPVLAEYRQAATVAAALVGKGGRQRAQMAFERAGLAVPPIYEAPSPIEEPRNVNAVTEETLSQLRQILAVQSEPLHGAIVSTVSALNFHCAHFCLSADLHVLVEKPATCPSRCCYDLTQAQQISRQLQELVDLARVKDRRFLVGAQRRYELVYNRVLDREVLGDSALHLISVLHTRGWSARTQLPPEISWRYNPMYTGGKIMHSGYHLIDIVMWWLSRRNTAISHARVSAWFERFSFPEFFEDGVNHNIERTAAIQVEFYRDDKCATLDSFATFLMTLGGPQGWTRDAYFVLTHDQRQLIIEGQRRQGVTLAAVVSVVTPEIKMSIDIVGAAAGNKEPTRDFLSGLVEGTRGREVSGGDDHVRSAKIVEAAYVSAIRGGIPEECEL